MDRNPFDIYREYVSLKTHFVDPDYNFFRNHPKNASIKAYNKRLDRRVFERLVNFDGNVTDLIVSNLILDHTIWPEFLIRSEARQNYLEREKRIQSLVYTFVEDLKKCQPKLDYNILCEKNELPHLIKLYLRSILSLETMVIVSDIMNCVPYWNEQLEKEFLWIDRLQLRLVKYRPFLVYNKDEFRRKLVETFKEMNNG